MLGFISKLWKVAYVNKGPRNLILMSLGQVMPLKCVSHGKKEVLLTRALICGFTFLIFWFLSVTVH